MPESVYLDKELVLRKLKSCEFKTREYVGKSDIWKFFSEVIDENEDFINYVICNSCNALFCYQFKKTGTSSLCRHVNKCSRGLIPSHAEKPKKFARSKGFSKSRKVSAYDSKKILNSCISVCTNDHRPHTIFEGKGMIILCQTLIDIGAKYGKFDIRSILPSGATISKYTVEFAALELKRKMEEISDCLKKEIHVAITTDIWTDNSSKKFYSVTCHYITQNWKLIHVSLGCQELIHEETDEHFKEELFNYLKDIGFKMEDLMTKCTFVTDCGSTIKTAPNQKWFPCIVYILNFVLYYTFSSKFTENSGLAVEDLSNSLDEECEFSEELEGLVTIVKNFVAHIKQAGYNEEIKFLKEENETLWYSKLKLLMNIGKEEEKIKEILEKMGEKEMLANFDFEKIKLLIEFLEPFRHASETLGGKFCTFHATALFKLKLEKHLEIKYNDIPLIQELKQKAQILMNDKYIIKPLYWVAAFLCPKFKGLSFLSNAQRNETYAMVRSLLTETENTSRYKPLKREPVENNKEPKADHSYIARDSKIGKFAINFDEFMDEREKEEKDEVYKYSNTSFVHDSFETHTDLIAGIDILMFWKSKENLFPKLSKLVRSILCIPATSAFSEGVLSTPSQVSEDRRNKLSLEPHWSLPNYENVGQYEDNETESSVSNITMHRMDHPLDAEPPCKREYKKTSGQTQIKNPDIYLELDEVLGVSQVIRPKQISKTNKRRKPFHRRSSLTEPGTSSQVAIHIVSNSDMIEEGEDSEQNMKPEQRKREKNGYNHQFDWNL